VRYTVVSRLAKQFPVLVPQCSDQRMGQHVLWCVVGNWISEISFIVRPFIQASTNAGIGGNTIFQTTVALCMSGFW
jgi:hypothetical protein